MCWFATCCFVVFHIKEISFLKDEAKKWAWKKWKLRDFSPDYFYYQLHYIYWQNAFYGDVYKFWRNSERKQSFCLFKHLNFTYFLPYFGNLGVILLAPKYWQVLLSLAELYQSLLIPSSVAFQQLFWTWSMNFQALVLQALETLKLWNFEKGISEIQLWFLESRNFQWQLSGDTSHDLALNCCFWSLNCTSVLESQVPADSDWSLVLCRSPDQAIKVHELQSTFFETSHWVCFFTCSI